MVLPVRIVKARNSCKAFSVHTIRLTVLQTDILEYFSFFKSVPSRYPSSFFCWWGWRWCILYPGRCRWVVGWSCWANPWWSISVFKSALLLFCRQCAPSYNHINSKGIPCLCISCNICELCACSRSKELTSFCFLVFYTLNLCFCFSSTKTKIFCW